MSGKVELFVGYVDKGVTAGAGGTSVVDQFNSDKSGFALVNQGAQTAAVVAGVTSIVKLTDGFVPFLNVATHTLAGTVTFLKISADYKTNQTFQAGDVINLVGNVAGVLGGMTLLAGFPVVATAFTAVAIGVNVYSIYNSGLVGNIHETLVRPVWEQYFQSAGDASISGHRVAPDLKLVHITEIQKAYSQKTAVVHWDPGSHSTVIASAQHDRYINVKPNVTGGGAGYVDTGQFGTGQIVDIPLVFPLPEPSGWSIDISIESINGRPGVDRYH